MRTTLTLFCILGATLIGFSQDKSFDLSKYKFPDYKRHELELNFNSSGVSDKHSYDEPSNLGNGDFVRNDYSVYYFKSNFRVKYKYDYLSRTRIDNLYSSLSGQYDFTKVSEPIKITKQIDPNFNWNFGGFRRYYLNEDKFFLEAGSDFGYTISESKKTIAGNVDTNNKSNSFNALINLGVGIGRMEKVSDLWQAYYILEKLKGQNSLARELEEKDIFEFASFASKLKNKRFFDFRLQKIAELQALDSLLHKQGLINETDIMYFTTLNDYWSFAYFQDRESGKVLKFWLSPEYSRYYQKSLGTSSQISTYTNLVSNLTFNCNKQLNLFWERHFNVLLSNETLIDKTSSNSGNYPENLFTSNIGLGYGYFPNTRTSISGSLGYQGYEIRYQQTMDDQVKQWLNTIYLGLDGHYFVSPQIQINASIRFSYYDKIYNSINPTQTSYNLGIQYAIF